MSSSYFIAGGFFVFSAFSFVKLYTRNRWKDENKEAPQIVENHPDYKMTFSNPYDYTLPPYPLSLNGKQRFR